MQGHNIIECIMDHLANQLGMDPVELRIKNFLKDGDTLVEISSTRSILMSSLLSYDTFYSGYALDTTTAVVGNVFVSYVVISISAEPCFKNISWSTDSYGLQFSSLS